MSATHSLCIVAIEVIKLINNNEKRDEEKRKDAIKRERENKR